MLFMYLSLTTLVAQNTIVVDDGPCLDYEVSVDGVVQAKLGDCEFESPEIIAGTTYTMMTDGDESALLNGISTIDLVEIQRGLLFGFDDVIDIYKADYDQDGAVSTYDLVELRSDILGITTRKPQFHVILTDQVVPNLDPFDIEVDYSTLNFTADDLQGSELPIIVLRIGDVR